MADLNINLLPEAQSAGKETKLKSLLNRALTIGGTIFVISTLIFSSILLYLSIQLRNVQAEKLQAEALVKNYQETEQKLFFVQDRIDKIKAVFAADTMAAGVESFNIILNTLPANSIIREADVNSANINMVIEMVDPNDLTAFLSTIVTRGFTKVNLKDFSFNPQTGYSLTMVFDTK